MLSDGGGSEFVFVQNKTASREGSGFACLERVTRLEPATVTPRKLRLSRGPRTSDFKSPPAMMVEAASSCLCEAKPLPLREAALLFWSGLRGSNPLPSPRTSDFKSPPAMTVEAASSCLCKTKPLPAREAVLLVWSGLRGSNSLPPPWQGGALPDELNPLMVPSVGIEPTTRGFSVLCSTN